MPVLTRSSLEASPLADLHELASELELDGFRRLRKADLVDRILDVHGAGEESGEDDAAPVVAEKPKRARARSRRPRDADTAADTGDAETGDDAPVVEPDEAPAAREPRAVFIHI
jgi:transcription termination factor Rho